MSPLASWVIVSYGDRPFLKSAVKSIINQTLNDYEIIIVTNDIQSYNKINSRLKKYSRNNIKVLINLHGTDNHFCLATALNYGIAKSDSKYIVRFDDDDINHPLRLQHQIKYMESKPNCGVLGSNALTFGRLITTWKMPTEDKQIKKELFFGNPFIHPSTIIRREILQGINGPYKPMSSAEDYELWTRLADTTQFGNLNENLLYYRVHSSNLHKANSRKTEKENNLKFLIREMSNKIKINKGEEFIDLHYKIFHTRDGDIEDFRNWSIDFPPSEIRDLGILKMENKFQLLRNSTSIKIINSKQTKIIFLTKFIHKIIKYILGIVLGKSRVKSLEGVKSRIHIYLQIFFFWKFKRILMFALMSVKKYSEI